MLQDHLERKERSKRGMHLGPRYTCDVHIATLLQDGRFAILMLKEHEDLRGHIDHCMLTTPKDCGPYLKELTDEIMYLIARAMDWLHNHDNDNIVHRDVKASNMLCSKDHENTWRTLVVADYEFSIGIVGTRFFRAPEILQACKNRTVSQSPECFTKKGDIYSYGMTCYEILIGKLPFEDREVYGYDHVLQGQ